MKWKSAKGDHQNGGYNEDILYKIFSKVNCIFSKSFINLEMDRLIQVISGYENHHILCQPVLLVHLNMENSFQIRNKQLEWLNIFIVIF